MLNKIRDWGIICMERPREEEGDVQDSGEDVAVTPAPGMGGVQARPRVQAGTVGAGAEGGSSQGWKGGCGPC